MGVKEVRFSDLSGEAGDDIESVRFGYDGRSLTVDLSAAEREALTSALAPYIEASTEVTAPQPVAPVTRRSAGTTPRKNTAASSQAGEIREWAAKYPHLVPGGKPLGDRGRIGVGIIEAYDEWKATNGQPTAATAPVLEDEVPTTRGRRGRRSAEALASADEVATETGVQADADGEYPADGGSVDGGQTFEVPDVPAVEFATSE